MKFIALKTEDGKKKRRIAFCCKMLGVSGKDSIGIW